MTHQVYNGDKPYIFVSYSHRDTARVLPLLEAMMERGYRIWYDQGIEAGSEWADNIARHLKDCFAFVACTSGSSVKSENCLDEIAFAKSNGKPSLMIFLENGVVLPEGTEMQTARFQRIYHLPDAPVERFIRDIGGASFLDPCREGYVPTAAAKRPAVTEKTRGRKRLLVPIIAAAIILTVILAVAGALALGRGSGGDVPDTGGGVGSASRPSSTEQEAGDSLSDSLSDFTYMLNGHVYALPTPFSELEANGWLPAVAGDPGEITIDSLGIRNSGIILGPNCTVSVIFYNPTGSVLPISECYVTSLTVTYKSGVSFVVSGDLSLDSNMTEIINIHGSPSSIKTDSKQHTIVSYSFQNDIPEASYVSFTLDNAPETRPGQIPDSNIKLYVPHHSFTIETETDTTVPDCVLDYEAPSELSTDIFSGIFCDDSKLYRLPVPFGELLDNGWVIRTEGVAPLPSDYVVGNGTDSYWLKYGNINAFVSVKNEAPNQIAVRNCMVYSMEFTRYSTLYSTDCALSPELRLDCGYVSHILDAVIDPAVERIVNESGDWTFYQIKKTYEDRTVTVKASIETETGYCQTLGITLSIKD